MRLYLPLWQSHKMCLSTFTLALCNSAAVVKGLAMLGHRMPQLVWYCPHSAQGVLGLFQHTQSLGSICSRTFSSFVLFSPTEIRLLTIINP